MGKWNRRYYPRSNRRGRYQDYDWSPPRETYRDPELGVWQDNVPMWEKKFCFLSGVPWEKVLSASKFMHCQSNIVEWDDAAGKEAFHSAKESYWAKLNGGGQSEIRAPDPDAYIGEIDWNPYIDPELIKDLDRNFFVPDDNAYNSSETFKDPWDHDHSHSTEALKNKAVGLDHWDQSVDTHEELAENNPWDSATTKLHEKDKATVWNQWDASVDAIDNPWERGQTSEMLKNKSAEKQSNRGNSWGYHDRNGTAANNYGSQNWRQRSYSNNGNNNYGSSYHHGGGSNDRRNNWGQNQCGGQYGGQRRGFVEDRGRKREGPGQYMTAGYKGPKLHYTDESSRRWKNGGDENGYVSKFNSYHN